MCSSDLELLEMLTHGGVGDRGEAGQLGGGGRRDGLQELDDALLRAATDHGERLAEYHKSSVGKRLFRHLFAGFL